MEKCNDCLKVFPLDELEPMSDNGGPVGLYCRECAGFPRHEYKVICPNCDIEIAVN